MYNKEFLIKFAETIKDQVTKLFDDKFATLKETIKESNDELLNKSNEEIQELKKSFNESQESYNSIIETLKNTNKDLEESNKKSIEDLKTKYEDIIKNTVEIHNKESEEIKELLKESTDKYNTQTEEFKNLNTVNETLQTEHKQIIEELKNKHAEILEDNNNAFIKKLNDIEIQVNKYLSSIPHPKNGEDGRDGRDAINLEINDGINFDKSYPKNTYATYKNGLWRATKQTEKEDGWECIVSGLSDISFDLEEDGRTLHIKTLLSNNKEDNKKHTLPILIYRGVYDSDEDYKQYDSVTHGGSILVAQKNAPGHPTLNPSHWKLAVKKGRDGKQGAIGKSGRDGKDGVDKVLDIHNTNFNKSKK